MKNIQRCLAILAFAFFAASCAKEDLKPDTANLPDMTPFKLDASAGLLNEDQVLQLLHLEDEVTLRSGAQPMLYTMSNEVGGNRIMAFERDGSSGSLTGTVNSYMTGGTGTDTYLANQGALAMSTNKKFMYAVNPGSNELSHFYIKQDGSLELLGTLASGGEKPVSVATYNGLVYVLNAGGNGNITGFGYTPQGQLTQLSNSTKPLSNTNAAAAQLDFSTNGKVLVVTEAGSNTITTFAMTGSGRPGIKRSYTTAGTTPMGFKMGNFNTFFVSEANGSLTGASTVSSYRVENSGMVSLVDGPFATNGTAAGSLVLSSNKQRIYAANSGSDNISALKVSGLGHLSLVPGGGSPTAALTTPVDAAMDSDSKNLYVLTSGNDAIITYDVATNGQLTQTSMYSSNLADAMSGMVVK